jgi:hypothetical protein
MLARTVESDAVGEDLALVQESRTSDSDHLGHRRRNFGPDPRSKLKGCRLPRDWMVSEDRHRGGSPEARCRH